MSNNPPAPKDLFGENGLRYIARVTASMSHEMKNVLAIINENNGLLEDLSFAAKRGKPIEQEKIDRTCSQVAKQIARADTILKTMSRFAHSFDHPEAPVDLHDLCQLVTTLAGRIASLRKVTLEVTAPPQPLTLARHPFQLQRLLWRCLELAIPATSEGRTLTLTPQAEAILIEGFDGLESLGTLSGELPVTISGEGAGRQLTLHLA